MADTLDVKKDDGHIEVSDAAGDTLKLISGRERLACANGENFQPTNSSIGGFINHFGQSTLDALGKAQRGPNGHDMAHMDEAVRQEVDLMKNNLLERVHRLNFEGVSEIPLNGDPSPLAATCADLTSKRASIRR